MPKKKAEVIQIVIVRWLDAYLMPDVEDFSALKPGCLQETYGRIVKEDDEAISIAHELSLDSIGARHVTTIPKAYVKDIFRFDCKIKNVQPKDNSEESGSSGKQ